MTLSKELLECVIDSGHIRADIDLESVAFILFTVKRNLNAYMMQTLTINPNEPDPAQMLREGKTEVEAVFERLLSMLRDGLT